MESFTSVWDVAGESAETEVALRALATAKAASAEIWPFLALAQDGAEFGQRLDLAEDTLTKAARANGVPVLDLVTAYTREFTLLTEARVTAAGGKCANCGCAEGKHDKGGKCSCGCKKFVTAEKTAAKGKVPDSFKEHQFKAADDEDDDSDDMEERTASERFGEDDNRDKATRDHDNFDPYEASKHALASMKTALEEGQDPLAWIEQEGGGQGVPEKPVEAGIEAAGTEVPADTQPPALGSRHPFARGAAWFGKGKPEQAPTSAPVDPLAGRETCPGCGSRQTKSLGGDSPNHKCFGCDAVFNPKTSAKTNRGRHPFAE